MMQKNTFVREDVQKLAEEDENDENDEEEKVEEEVVDEEEEEEEEEELEWKDVFEGIDTKITEESDATSKKEPRVATNKRKATNFYSSANVKNKSRKKALFTTAVGRTRTRKPQAKAR